MENIISYIKQSKEELSKVIFPTQNEIKQGFISVIAVVTFVALFIGLVDFIISLIINSVL